MYIKKEYLTCKEYVGNLKEYKDIIKRPGITLFQAGTSTGKTTGICQFGTQIALEEETNAVFLIAMPNRSQCIQLGSKSVVRSDDGYKLTFTKDCRSDDERYDVFALVGGISVNEYNNQFIVACVWEKLVYMFNNLKKRGKKIYLVIDEAHELYNSGLYDERKVITDRIFELLYNDYIKNVMLITATPEKPLLDADLKIDYYVVSKAEQSKTKMDKLIIVRYKDWPEESIANIIHKQVEETGGKVVCRVNNKQTADNMKILLSGDKYTVECIDASNKSDSDSYGSINYDSKIPDSVNIVMTTALVDSGVSIMNSRKDTWMYVSTTKELDLDSIKQSFNRFRNKYETGILFIKDRVPFFNEKNIDKAEQDAISEYKNCIKCMKKMLIPDDIIVRTIKNLLDDIRDNFTVINYLEIDDKFNIEVNSVRKAIFIAHNRATGVVNFDMELEYELGYLADRVVTRTIDEGFEKKLSVANKALIGTNVSDIKATKRELKAEKKKDIKLAIQDSFRKYIIPYLLDIKTDKTLYNNLQLFICVFRNNINLNTLKGRCYTSFAKFYHEIVNGYVKEDVFDVLNKFIKSLEESSGYYTPKQQREFIVKLDKSDNLYSELNKIKKKGKPILMNQLISTMIESDNSHKRTFDFIVAERLQSINKMRSEFKLDFEIDIDAIKKEVEGLLGPTTSSYVTPELNEVMTLRLELDSRIGTTITTKSLEEITLKLKNIIPTIDKDKLLRLIKTYYNLTQDKSKKKKTYLIKSLKTHI